jgi:hypothetical protein
MFRQTTSGPAAEVEGMQVCTKGRPEARGLLRRSDRLLIRLQSRILHLQGSAVVKRKSQDSAC